MQVEVLFFGRIREATGISQELVTVADGATLNDLLKVLKTKFGSVLTRELRASRRPMVLVNGRNMQSLQGSRTALQDKDLVAILPAMFGG